MKKFIVFILAVLIVAFIVSAFIFDWGRNDAVISPSVQNATTSSDMPNIFSPVDGQTVTSPIQISGKVSSNWFFEGSFPVELIDSDGDVIATATAETSGDWATTSVINFSATLVYPKATTTDRGLIMLKNDNSSGNSQLDKEKFIQVILK